MLTRCKNQRTLCNFSIWTVADVGIYKKAALWQRCRETARCRCKNRYVPKLTAASRGSPCASTALVLVTMRCYEECGYATECRLSVCQSVCYVQICFHTGWNTSKIIPRLNSLRYLLRLTPTWALWTIGTPPPKKIGWNRGGVMSIKTEISPKRCKIGPRLLWRDYYEVAYSIPAFDWYQNQWSWNYFRSISTYVIMVPESDRLQTDRQRQTTYCGITALCVAYRAVKIEHKYCKENERACVVRKIVLPVGLIRESNPNASQQSMHLKDFWRF